MTGHPLSKYVVSPMKKKKAKTRINRKLSADIINYLNRHEGKTFKQIGKLIGVSESDISHIGKGRHCLTVERLMELEKSLKKPLPVLFVEAMSESVTEEMKPAYEELRRLLRRQSDSVRELFGIT